MPTCTTFLLGPVMPARQASVIQKLSPVSVYPCALTHVPAAFRPTKGDAAEGIETRANYILELCV